MNPLSTLPIYLLIACSIGMSAVAQLLLKLGASQRVTSGLSGQLTAFASSPYVVGGFALYGLGAVVWLFVLAKLPLSVAYPFVGVGFVLTMMLGGLVLNEALSPLRVAGTLLVVLGCTMVAVSAGKPA